MRIGLQWVQALSKGVVMMWIITLQIGCVSVRSNVKLESISLAQFKNAMKVYQDNVSQEKASDSDLDKSKDVEIVSPEKLADSDLDKSKDVDGDEKEKKQQEKIALNKKKKEEEEQKIVEKIQSVERMSQGAVQTYRKSELSNWDEWKRQFYNRLSALYDTKSSDLKAYPNKKLGYLIGLPESFRLDTKDEQLWSYMFSSKEEQVEQAINGFIGASSAGLDEGTEKILNQIRKQYDPNNQWDWQQIKSTKMDKQSLESAGISEMSSIWTETLAQEMKGVLIYVWKSKNQGLATFMVILVHQKTDPLYSDKEKLNRSWLNLKETLFHIASSFCFVI